MKHTHTLGCDSSPKVLSLAVSSLKCARRPLSSSCSLISSFLPLWILSQSSFSSFHPKYHSRSPSVIFTWLHFFPHVSFNLSILGLDHTVNAVENTVGLVQLMYCVCVCVWGRVAFLYEWLLGRTGGVREEFVNYEWSTSLWMWITQWRCVCVRVRSAFVNVYVVTYVSTCLMIVLFRGLLIWMCRLAGEGMSYNYK